MIETRLNFSKWFVKYRYSPILDKYQWRVWRPYQQAASMGSFDSASDAHNWIANHPR